MDEGPKISLVETILLVLFVGAADVVEIILVFFALDDFGLSDIIVGSTVGFYFLMKGEKWAWALSGNLIELIPYLGALPIKSITLWIAIYLTNHPKTVPGAQIVGATTVKGKPGLSTPGK